jgi:hypothetical protein
VVDGNVTVIPVGPVKSSIISALFFKITLVFPIASAHLTWILFIAYVPSANTNELDDISFAVHVLPLSSEYSHVAASYGISVTMTVLLLFVVVVVSGKVTTIPVGGV